jgi:hypothetical protein
MLSKRGTAFPDAEPIRRYCRLPLSWAPFWPMRVRHLFHFYAHLRLWTSPFFHICAHLRIRTSAIFSCLRCLCILTSPFLSCLRMSDALLSHTCLVPVPCQPQTPHVALTLANCITGQPLKTTFWLWCCPTATGYQNPFSFRLYNKILSKLYRLLLPEMCIMSYLMDNDIATFSCLRTFAHMTIIFVTALMDFVTFSCLCTFAHMDIMLL